MGLGSTACPGQREEVCAPRGFLEKSLSKKSAEENMAWGLQRVGEWEWISVVIVRSGDACHGCTRLVTYTVVTRQQASELKKYARSERLARRNVFYLHVLSRPRQHTMYPSPKLRKGASQAAA